MTKEELLISMELLIKNKTPDVAAQLIWVLWMDHHSYIINGTKVVNKESGEEIKI